MNRDAPPTCGPKARNGSTGPHMRGDAPPTYRTESSEWVFAAVHCSILPELSMCLCPSLDQHGHMHGGA